MKPHWLLHFLRGRFGSISYSQCGEDMIIDFIFKAINVSKPSYLDIGAYHPKLMSNTFKFYQRGSCGICVEPDPTKYRYLKRVRKRDICLNAGVGKENVPKADFFVISPPTLSTFSNNDAEQYQLGGTHELKEVLQIPILSVNHVIDSYWPQCPDLISIDVEGMEYEILETFDFSRFRPTIFCVETLSYTVDKSEKKQPHTTKLMLDQGYFVYADTYINTVFVDQATWSQR